MGRLDDHTENAGLFVEIGLRNLPKEMQPVATALSKNLQLMLTVLEHYQGPDADDLTIYSSDGVTKILKDLPVTEIDHLLQSAKTATGKEVADIFATKGLNPNVVVEILEMFPELNKRVNTTLTDAVSKIVQAGSLEASQKALEGTSGALTRLNRETNNAVCVTIDTRKTPERNVGELIFVLYYIICKVMDSARNNTGIRKEIRENVPDLANLAPAIADIFSLLVLQSVLGAGLLPAIKDLLNKLDIAGLVAKFNELLRRLHEYKCTPSTPLTKERRRLLIDTYQGYLDLLRRIHVVREAL